MNPRIVIRTIGALWACAATAWLAAAASAQSFHYEPKSRVDLARPGFAQPDPAPRMMLASERLAERPGARVPFGRPAPPHLGSQMAERVRYENTSPRYRGRLAQGGPRLVSEPIAPGHPAGPAAEELPFGGQTGEFVDSPPPMPGSLESGSFGDAMYEGQPFAEQPFDEFGHGSDHGGPPCAACGQCGGCDDCEYCGPCYIDMLHSLCDCLKHSYLFSSGMWKNLSLITGKQGFKGPADLGQNGNFGYNGGINWGSPFWHKAGIGYQLGGSILASDFEGRSGPLGSRRTQYFVTTGLYHRARCNHGLQGGVVFDYLHDEFYVDLDLTQLRGEISFVHDSHELGFWFATHLNSDSQTAPNFLEQTSLTFTANDQFNIFYRYQFCNGATARTWAGLSGHGDGIFGGDAIVGFSPRWAVQTSYNYLLPRNDPSIPSNVKESWNLAINLVWNIGYHKGECDWFNPYRPLFHVADNGWFLQRLK